jgi:hypothetical protein
MTEQNTSFIDFLETHPARLASDSTKKWLAEFYLAGYATGERAAFTRGVKAMFDALLCRAANHFHADPKIQAQCDAENKLITDWAEDALEEVSPESCREWKSSEESYRSGYAAGECAARQQFTPLYHAVNELMAYMGAHGSAEARGDRAQAVMDALHAIDGGQYQTAKEPTT